MRTSLFPFYLLVLLSATASAAAGLMLSEAMADPAAVADAQGEFLEVGNPHADTLALDSLRISTETQSLAIGPLRIPPGGVALVCRDSLSASNGGMDCLVRWPSLALANGRALRVSLSGAGWRNDFHLPASRPGVSWENTWDGAAGFDAFLPSRGTWKGGDSATPGFRNSRSLRPAARNLGITGVTWEKASVGSGEDRLRVRVAGYGPLPAGAAWLSLRLDADWDGEAETLIDSVPAVADIEAIFPLGSGQRGQVRVALALNPPGLDEDPGDDIFMLAVEDGATLALSEWHPAPAAGVPEWVEIRNRTAEADGGGRRLDLSRAAFNGYPLGARAGLLDPGEYAVLTASVAGFRARYGEIRARVLQPEGWRALRNTGDTLTLALGGSAVDTVIYGPIADDTEGTPGFPAAEPETAGWELSGRVASRARPLEVEVRAPPGSRYVLRVFDLEGNRVRTVGEGGEGRRSHSWEGRSDGGRLLPKGPYVLCLTFGNGATRKRAVLAEP